MYTVGTSLVGYRSGRSDVDRRRRRDNRRRENKCPESRGRVSAKAHVLDGELERLLAERFTDTVMHVASLAAARRTDIRTAPRFSVASGEIVCTCAITGST